MVRSRLYNKRMAYQERSAYDPTRRRRSIRLRPEDRGVWIFIPAAELRAAGIEPPPRGGRLPRFRVWGRSRGSVLVRLYRQEEEGQWKRSRARMKSC